MLKCDWHIDSCGAEPKSGNIDMLFFAVTYWLKGVHPVLLK